jgi:predicted kinase
MPKCTILVGVPGSGKSTWFSKNKTATMAPISTDNIIEFMGSLFGFTYDQIFSDSIKLADKIMWKRLEWNAERSNDVVIDRTNLTAKSRKKFIDFLKPFGYEFEAVVFPLPGTVEFSEEEWFRRLDSRQGKTIPNAVLASMVNSAQMPSEEEGFTKITVL